MTKDDIIRMARETGLLTEHNYREIINFGSMVAAAEREACAKFIEDEYVRDFDKQWRIDLTEAIRAREQR